MPGAPILVLGWRLADQLFGLDVRNVVHIEEQLATRQVPRPRAGVVALTFYQDCVVPVLDLARILLGEADHQWSTEAKYLVLRRDAARNAAVAQPLWATKVDTVVRIFTLNAKDLTTWTKPPDHPAACYVRAVAEGEEGSLWLVDLRRVLRQICGDSPTGVSSSLSEERVTGQPAVGAR